MFADATHYPAFMAWKAAHDAVNESISNIGGVPEAIGEVRYLDRARWRRSARTSGPRWMRCKGGLPNRS